MREGLQINNWNPWCNSNCLSAFLLMEKDHKRRCDGVHKCMRSINIFIDTYQEDGGCDEGSSYWGRAGGSLFDCLELLYGAANGLIDFYTNKKICEIGRFMNRVHIGNRYFINFADGAAKVKIPAELLYRYGKRISDEELSKLAAFENNLQGNEVIWDEIYSLFRVLPIIFDDEIIREKAFPAPLLRDSWIEGIQTMAAREMERATDGLYLAAKGRC